MITTTPDLLVGANIQNLLMSLLHDVWVEANRFMDLGIRRGSVIDNALLEKCHTCVVYVFNFLLLLIVLEGRRQPSTSKQSVFGKENVPSQKGQQATHPHPQCYFQY